MAGLYMISVEEAEKIPREFFLSHFPERLKKAEKYVRKNDSLLSLGVGALIYKVLGVDEDSVKVSKFGKPYIPNRHGDFSVSHSGKYSILAVSDGKVGCDIEKPGKFRLSVAKRFFTEEEYKLISDGDTDLFYRIWTLKESVVKAIGTGFHTSPDSFSVLPLTEGQAINIDGTTLKGQTVTVSDHIISVCGEGGIIINPHTEISHGDIDL